MLLSSARRCRAGDAAVGVRERLEAPRVDRPAAAAADAVGAGLELRERAVDLGELGGRRFADAGEHGIVLHLHDLFGKVLVERAGGARDVRAHLGGARHQLLLLLFQLAPDGLELGRHGSLRWRGRRPRAAAHGSRQFTCTSTVLGFGAGVLGTRTFSMPFRLSAWIAATSASSGSRKLRAKWP